MLSNLPPPRLPVRTHHMRISANAIMLLPAAHLYELLRDAAVTCRHNTGGDLCEAKRAFSEPSSHPHNFHQPTTIFIDFKQSAVMAQTHRGGAGKEINYKEYQQEIGRRPPFFL